MVFAAQSRADVRAQLAVRANLAGQLVAQGVGPAGGGPPGRGARGVALLVTPDGQRFGAVDADGAQRLPPPRPTAATTRCCAAPWPTARS